MPEAELGIGGDGAWSSDAADANRVVRATQVHQWRETAWMKEQSLVAPATAVGWGGPTAVLGDTLLATGWEPNPQDPERRQVVYTYEHVAPSWHYRSTIKKPDGTQFGSVGGIGLSEDVALIGSCGMQSYDDPRAVFVYERRGEDWVFTGELSRSGASQADFFGCAVAIEGRTAVVGAPGYLSLEHPGSVYIYGRTPTGWVEQQRLVAPSATLFDGFGRAVSLRGDTLLVSAGGGGGDVIWGPSGTAHVFTRRSTGWVHTAQISLNEPDAARHVFTAAQGVTDDFIVVGNTVHGTIQWLARDGDGWRERPALPGPRGGTYDYPVRLVAAGRHTVAGGSHAYEWTGLGWQPVQPPANGATAEYWDLTLSGDSAAVGYVHAGVTFVQPYVRQGRVWTRTDPIELARDVRLVDATIAIDGDHLLVSPGQEMGKSPSQSARVYRRSGRQWSIAGELRDPNGGALVRGVALSGDTALVVSAEQREFHLFARDLSGWKHQYTLPVPAAEAERTRATLADSTLLVLGPARTQTYVKSGNTWHLEQELLHEGRALRCGGAAIGDDLIAASCSSDAAQGLYVFAKSAGLWRFQTALTRSQDAQLPTFPTRLAVSRDTIVAGAQGQFYPYTYWGAYIFARQGAEWVEVDKLKRSGPLNVYPPTHLQVSDDTVLLGLDPRPVMLRRAPSRPTGAACARATDCASGVCREGVCCDASCTAPCRACAGAITGLADGTCSTRPAGSRCSADPAACAGDGVSYALASTCDAAGECVARHVQCAGGFACVGDETSGYCSRVCLNGGQPDHSLCAESHWCSTDPNVAGGVCVPDRRGAEPCTSDFQCASGECDQARSSCLAAEGDPCGDSGAGSCASDLRCVTTVTGTRAVQTCVAGEHVCDGFDELGPDNVPVPCHGFRCAEGACLESCGGPEQCAPGYSCRDAECVDESLTTTGEPGDSTDDEDCACRTAGARRSDTTLPALLAGLTWLAAERRRRRAPGAQRARS